MTKLKVVTKASRKEEFQKNLEDKKKRAEDKKRQEIKRAKEYQINLANKLNSTGFDSLTSTEVKYLVNSLYGFFKSEMSSEEMLLLAKATLADKKAEVFLNFRFNALSSTTTNNAIQQLILSNSDMLKEIMNGLSKINKNTSYAKLPLTMTGAVAAKQLGEQLGNSFGD